jgi:hypothetical protein
MRECDCTTPPTLDQTERNSTHVQFLTHMRCFLSDASSEIADHVVHCCGTTIIGARYDHMMQSARNYAYNLACLLDSNVVTDVDFCFFAMEALATKTHGSFGHCMRSLCSTDVICVHTPTENQDPAVWMLWRAIMSASELNAKCIVDTCVDRIPHALACIGFMALMVRTPLSSALLTVGRVDSSGLSPLFSAMKNAVDPQKQRSPFDIVMATEAAEFHAGQSVCQQFSTLVDVWLLHLPLADTTEQREVDSGTVRSRMSSLTRISRLDGVAHAQQWEGIAFKTAELLEKRRGVPDVMAAKCAHAWASVWNNIFNALLLSKSILSRRLCTSVVVLWFYHDDLLYCIARKIPYPPTARCVKEWTLQCSDAVEEAARWTGVVPTPPRSKVQRRAALKMLHSGNRWTPSTFPKDNISRVIMGKIAVARSLPSDGGVVRMAQGAFLFASFVAVVSFKDSEL